MLRAPAALGRRALRTASRARGAALPRALPVPLRGRCPPALRDTLGDAPRPLTITAAAAAPASASVSSPSGSGGGVTRPPRDTVLTGHPANNVPESIYDRMGAGHHVNPAHPIGIIKDAIHAYFDGPGGRGATFDKLDDLPAVVAAAANFDAVLVPPDHVSRSPNDTYYVDDATVLRCHTSAHQAELLAAGRTAFLVTGDVYRRDSVDASHYPVFHQMEGVRVFGRDAWGGAPGGGTAHAEAELKATLEGLAAHLFGAGAQTRWVDAYFPFTHPSFELEVLFNGEWLEVLGCGVVQPAILAAAGVPADRAAWAFGLGLERLAMVLFGIPDIRLFWCADPRFTSQFAPGDMAARFKPFSKFPPCFKDVSFWQPAAGGAVSENDVCEVVRSVAGDLAEAVTLIDDFVHPKTGRASRCYRIAYRSMERSLEDEEINELQARVRAELAGGLGVELSGPCLRRWASHKPSCPLCKGAIVSILCVATGDAQPPPPPRPPSAAPPAGDDDAAALAFLDHTTLAAEATALLSRVAAVRVQAGRRRTSSGSSSSSGAAAAGGVDAAALDDVAAAARGVLALARSPDAFDPGLAMRCLTDLATEVDALRRGGSGDPERRASWGAALAVDGGAADDDGDDGAGFDPYASDGDDRPPPQHVFDFAAALEEAALRGGGRSGRRRRG